MSDPLDRDVVEELIRKIDQLNKILARVALLKVTDDKDMIKEIIAELYNFTVGIEL